MTSSGGRQRGAGWLRGVAWLALSWGVIVGTGVGFAMAVSGTALSRPQLPPVLRDQLVAWEALLIGLVVWVGGGALLALAGASQRCLSRRADRVVRGVLGSVLAGALVFYCASWVTFAGGGRFLDPEMIAFLAMSPLQFAQHALHIDPWLTLAVPLLLLAPAALIGLGLPRLVDRMGRMGQIVVVLAAIASGFYAWSLSPGEPDTDRATLALGKDFRPHRPVQDPAAGLVYSYSELLEISRDDRIGPVSHLAALIREWIVDPSAGIPIDPAIEVAYPPQIEIEEWLASVDRSSLKRWNVIVAVVESLRVDQLVVFGGEREVMPFVEALAAESLRYSDHYTQASHSNYADLAILSSHYPLRGEQVHVYPENPTYPRILIYDLLKPLGWNTAVISSQDENWGRMINYLSTGNVDHFFHSETFEGLTYVPRDDTGFANFMKGEKRSGKIDDRFTVDEAIRWIASLPESEPYFIYLNLQNSHLPYETPADFPRRFGPHSIDFTIRFNDFPRARIETVKDIYADSLAYTDHQLGRLIEYLKDSGQWGRTLLVVTGDTGQAFYEHGFAAHANMVFDEVMRVPLLMRVPGGEGVSDARPAQHIDIPPTILDLLGLPSHPGLQGVSLIAKEPDPLRSRYLVAQTPLAHQYAVVRGRHKLLYDVRHDKVMLVDLESDPGEQQSLVHEDPALTAELLRRLGTWRRHQVDYYDDLSRHRRFYPPHLAD